MGYLQAGDNSAGFDVGIRIKVGVQERIRFVEGSVRDEDVEACVVPGLERAISKSKGIEFGSLLHQLGADFTANRYSPGLHEVLLQINPDVKGRLPRRRRRKKGREDTARADEKTKRLKEIQHDKNRIFAATMSEVKGRMRDAKSR